MNLKLESKWLKYHPDFGTIKPKQYYGQEEIIDKTKQN